MFATICGLGYAWWVGIHVVRSYISCVGIIFAGWRNRRGYLCIMCWNNDGGYLCAVRFDNTGALTRC